MSTPLTLYFSKVADSGLTSAGDLAIATGGALGNVSMTLGPTATGFSELYALGNAGAWAQGSSLFNPTGNGFILPAATLNLAGNQLVAGNWTATIRLQLGGTGVGGSVTADLYCRAYKRTSGGVYIPIGSAMLLSGQSITTTTASHTFAVASLPSMNFSGGDALYIDCPCNVTANNTTGVNPLIKLFAATTNTNGVATAQLITAGYQGLPSSSAFGGARRGHRGHRGFRGNRSY